MAGRRWFVAFPGGSLRVEAPRFAAPPESAMSHSILAPVREAVAVLSLAGAAAGQNLIINPGFELTPQGYCGGGCQCLSTFNAGNNIVGWTVTSAVPGLYGHNYKVDRTTHGCGGPVNAAGGSYCIDLQGAQCCGCNNNGGIAQTVATQVGSRYRLSFDAVVSPNDILEIIVNGTIYSVTELGGLAWRAYSLEVVALGATMTVELRSNPYVVAGCELDGAYCPLIDNVSLVAIESTDLDGDGVSDPSDNCPGIANPGQGDCDNDGIGDACAIAAGAPDSNGNGVPDGCECIGDLFVDGQINGADLGALLSQWGPATATTASDLNSDGVVNGLDLGNLLSRWGVCVN